MRTRGGDRTPTALVRLFATQFPHIWASFARTVVDTLHLLSRRNCRTLPRHTVTKLWYEYRWLGQSKRDVRCGALRWRPADITPSSVTGNAHIECSSLSEQLRRVNSIVHCDTKLKGLSIRLLARVGPCRARLVAALSATPSDRWWYGNSYERKHPAGAEGPGAHIVENDQLELCCVSKCTNGAPT